MSLRSSGGRKLPSLEILDRLSRALGLSVLEVLDGVAPYDRVIAPRRRPRKARRGRYVVERRSTRVRN